MRKAWFVLMCGNREVGPVAEMSLIRFHQQNEFYGRHDTDFFWEEWNPWKHSMPNPALRKEEK